MAKIHIESPIYTGYLKVHVTNQPFVVPVVQILLGNEAKGSKIRILPLVADGPFEAKVETNPEIFSICSVTRDQTQQPNSPLLIYIFSIFRHLVQSIIFRN